MDNSMMMRMMVVMMSTMMMMVVMMMMMIVMMSTMMMMMMMMITMMMLMSMSMSMMIMMLLCRLSIKAVNDRNESLRRRLYDGNYYCYLCVVVCLISDKCAYCTNTLPSTVKLLVTAIT